MSRKGFSVDHFHLVSIGDTIVQVSHGPEVYKLGDRVHSSASDLDGTVIRIHKPNHQGHGLDVLEVWWDEFDLFFRVKLKEVRHAGK